MIEGLLIEINGKNVTSNVLAESFPDYYEQSFKGVGMFDFEVKPLTFKIFDLTVKRGDRALIKWAGTGQKLMQGVIDQIEDSQTSTPEITIYPDTLVLKDTILGQEIDTGDEEKVREFDTGGYKSLRDIVRQIINEIRTQKGIEFRVDETTIPPSGAPDKKNFFGNLLMKLPRQGLLAGLIDFIFPGERGYHFRTKNGLLYIIENDAHFDFKTFWAKGSWINFTIEIPPSKIDLGITAIKKGSWLTIHFRIPPFDLKFPTIGARYNVYRAIAGGVEYLWTHGFYPLPPFFDGPPNLNDKYGGRINKKTSQNITQKKIKAFLSEEGFDPDSLNLEAIVDYDDKNSYVICTARKKYSDLSLFQQDLVLSFETPFDGQYWLTYRDTSAMDILRDLAVVTNRYLFISEDNCLYLLPRESGLEEVSIPRSLVLEYSRRQENVETSNLNINRYERDDQGRVISYGIRIRKNEWAAIENYYKGLTGGTRVETTFKLFESEVRLMNRIFFDGNDCGMVIERRKGLREPLMEIITEKYEE